MSVIEISDSMSVGDSGDINDKYMRLHQQVTCMEPKFQHLEGKIDALGNMFQTFKRDIVKEVVEQVVSCLLKGKIEEGAKTKGFDFKTDGNCPLMESEAQSNNSPDESPLKKRRTNAFPYVQLNVDTKSNNVGSKCSRSPKSPNGPKRRRRIAKVKRPFTCGPFLLADDTSNEIVDLLNFIFMKRPLTREEAKFDNEIVASCDGFSVTRSDLEECLNPGKYLDDSVINIYASLLNENKSDNWFLPTYFAAGVATAHKRMNEVKWTENVYSLCKLDRFRGRMKEATQIFIPMHDNINKQLGHWYLLLVSLQCGQAILVDSAPDISRECIRVGHARRVLHLLDKVFEDKMKLYMPCGFHFATLPWATGEIFPIQTNDFDCGVFVIRNMQHFRKKWNEKYVSEDHRASLAIECVRHQRNELDDVKSMIQQCLRLGGNLEPVVHLLSSDCT
ncbi:uncharacterized protein LOC126802867 [Argentina anserina]|uniref:uncharacterized protein LOC126802867 n=1 Tax=Argentina anserina TaxID=57926 RepID=UPI0021768AB0|nr:uncharacterized protein LOC126802867 [Potentilla anserina]